MIAQYGNTRPNLLVVGAMGLIPLAAMSLPLRAGDTRRVFFPG
jgi:hypothetical protein